jgi:TRAP-type C4-dicarboxylate transport system permease small subunit
MRASTHIVLHKLEKAGSYAEDTVLVVILIGMILLAGTQIFLRNIFDTGIFWGDEMLRLMVLWITVAGGLAASRMDRHISIEVLDRFLPQKVQLFTKIIIDLFTSSVCALFAWHSARFVMGSYEFGDTLLKDTPAWMLQIILPIGFALMAYRHLVLAIKRPFDVSGNLTGTDVSQ